VIRGRGVLVKTGWPVNNIFPRYALNVKGNMTRVMNNNLLYEIHSRANKQSRMKSNSISSLVYKSLSEIG
jgi:hypothetical protein